MKDLIIAFGCEKGHGKDTAANAIQNHIWRNAETYKGWYATKANFGDPVKDELAELLAAYHYRACPQRPDDRFRVPSPEELFRMYRGELDDPERKERYRVLMQWWATEFKCHTFGDRHWCERVEERLQNKRLALGPTSYDQMIVLVADLRFLAEAEWLRERGAKLIKAHRPDRDADPARRRDDHVSENQLRDWDGWDFVLENDGDLAQLERRAVRLFRDLWEAHTR